MLTPAQRTILSILILITAGSVLLWLAQGPEISSRIYLSAVSLNLLDVGDTASTASLTLLLVIWAALALAALRQRDLRRLIGLILGGIGATLAYATSEILKLMFANVRPCSTYEVLAACPAADNWSYPSNHTVIAFSLAVVLIACSRHMVWIALPLAALAGVSRVFSGQHYPHDVLAGAVLGVAVTTVVLMTASRPAESLVRGTLGRLPAGTRDDYSA